MRPRFLLSIFLLFSFSLARGEPTAFDQKFNTLQKSMTPANVKTLLGPPDLRELKGGVETWHFNENGGRVVVFDKSGVIEFGKDEPHVVAATPIVEPVLRNLDIGLACKEDIQCASQNCHFHTCSGKNNCMVPLGKICAINSDCCSGFCDFGKCKIH